MVHIDTRRRELIAKVVYYGPGMSGKTTNLARIHERSPADTRGDLVSVNTEADRTLYFDFLPMDLGNVAGMRVRLQLYTVPGQVYYNATRKLVLQNVDGVVFVADSARGKRHENIASLINLHENMAALGQDIDHLPLVLQYNKRDLRDALSLADLDNDLNAAGRLTRIEAVANDARGVFQTLKAITQAVVERIQADQAEAVAARVGNTPLSNRALVAGKSATATASASQRRRHAVTVMAPKDSGPFRVLDRTPPTGGGNVIPGSGPHLAAVPAAPPQGMDHQAQAERDQELLDLRADTAQLHLRLLQLEQRLQQEEATRAPQSRLTRLGPSLLILALLTALTALVLHWRG